MRLVPKAVARRHPGAQVAPTAVGSSQLTTTLERISLKTRCSVRLILTNGCSINTFGELGV